MEKFLEAIISNEKNLKASLPSLALGKKEIEKGVHVGRNVKIEPNTFFDTSGGPIVIDEGTKIKANSILRGPLFIGKDCVVNSFAEISHSNIGDVCRVGGEIENCVMQSYSNKQHYGYIGHSYIGSWVNLGAGTNISDLKNTYSTIKMKGKDTGQVKLGAVIGDYCKTAINTSIFCGKVIGVSSHLYGTVTEDVSPFTSHVAPGKLYELPLELAVKIQRAMAGRRDVEFTRAHEDKVRKLFEESQEERNRARVKKEKLSFL